MGSHRTRIDPLRDAVEVIIKAQHGINVVTTTQRDRRGVYETQRLIVVAFEHIDSIFEDCR